VKLVPYPEADVCCGSAGIYNMTEPEMSTALLERKMDFLAKLDADCVATGNPGCYLQLAKGVRQLKLSMEVVHPIELLWRSYQAAG
jgi:glycolate oxidase iron-sulfur subunit